MGRGDIIPSRGAVAEPLVIEVQGTLTADDIARLHTAPKVAVPMLQRLRATHHRQALLLAEGKTVSQVAAIVGCTTARLTQLQKDPAFVDLVAYYQDQVMAAMLSDTARLADKIVDVGEMAVDELRERLEDDAQRKSMRTEEVRKIAEFAMDRTVAPPKAAPGAAIAPAQVTINFGTSLRLPSELRDDTDGPAGPVIEGTVTAEARGEAPSVGDSHSPSVVKPKGDLK